MRKHITYTDDKVSKKKTRQGCGIYSKGMKKYKGQGGPRKRCKLPKKYKHGNNYFNSRRTSYVFMPWHVMKLSSRYKKRKEGR